MMTQAKPNKLKQAYQAVFLAPNGEAPQAQQMVLADLAKFCAVEAASPVQFDTNRCMDPNATWVALGRLEVIRRIQGYLAMPDTDLIRFARLMTVPQGAVLPTHEDEGITL